MIALLIAVGILSLPTLGVLLHMRNASQQQLDADRLAYELIFPKGLTDKQVEAAIRSIGSNLQDNKLKGDPSIALEVMSSPRGVRHMIRVPSRDAEYLMGQLEGHIPGIDVTPIEHLPDIGYDFGAQLSMSDPARTMPITNITDHAVKILKSLETTERELVTLQYVITHTARVKVIESNTTVLKSKPRFRDYLFGSNVASNDEVQDRRVKVSDQNYGAVGRIAAKAKSEARARELVMKVLRALRSESSPSNRIDAHEIPYRNLDAVVNSARTPSSRTMQFTVSELAAFIGWPVGDPQIPGLAQGSARRFPATETIPRDGGRILGHSNVPGRERPIALPYSGATTHTFIGGKTGVGKSTQMANNAYDDMRNGLGVIVIDASASASRETVYNRVLNYVPPDRVNDVIALNVHADVDFPIAFNLFDQGSGRGAIDQIVGVFTQLYPTIATGVAVRDLLYHGIWTLLDHGDLTFADLGTLISPRNPAEKAWSRNVRQSVAAPELKEFWERVQDRNGDVEPRDANTLHNKLWQLAGRPEIKHIIGQSSSTLNMRDVLANNKILLISLSGLPKESAELLGSLITTVLWDTAQSMTPEKPNFLYLDEFQVSARVQNGLDDLLARARKHRLGLTLATQYIETIERELKTAIVNNTGTRIIYETSSTEARIWIPEFGGTKLLSETDFTGIKKYEAIATIATDSGTSAPVTMKALKPYEPTGMAQRVLEQSRRRFGRPVDQVRQEIINRRRPSQTEPSVAPKPIGRTDSPYKKKES